MPKLELGDLEAVARLKALNMPGRSRRWPGTAMRS